MAGLLEQLDERVKALASDWTKYSVIGGVLLYVVGYLALRFHLTAIGIGTDLAVLDERYLFTGARFLVYLVATVPIIVLIGLPLAALVWILHRYLPETVRSSICSRVLTPSRLLLLGIVFSVAVIQFVMRQCFLLNNLLLAPTLPNEPAWLIGMMVEEVHMPLYFSGLVAACIVPIAIVWSVRASAGQTIGLAFARALLAFLAAVQVLFLPVNYGVLILD